MVDLEDLKAEFLNLEFDVKDFELDPQAAVRVAKVTGETRPEYLDPQHPNFQATTAHVASLASRRHYPVNFPNLGGIPMDGGKAVHCLKPVRPGTPLTRRTHVHDIYDKKGRSGRMVFIVARTEIYDAAGECLATTDSRGVIREKPAS